MTRRSLLEDEIQIGARLAIGRTQKKGAYDDEALFKENHHSGSAAGVVTCSHYNPFAIK
jgi:hypothetical protein